ncbi:MAG: hypothetical protein LC725_09435 [Lentisphaerae bacterium]|nr:hypothetical protein [Lentisphaerota bacterium]
MILSAAMAVGALLGAGRLPAPGSGLSVLVRRGLAFLASAFWLLPVYVIVHGHLSPGGGFQGGVGLVALLVLLTVAYGTGLLPRLLPLRRLAVMEYLAALALLLAGCYGLWRAEAFLGNRVAGLPLGIPGAMLSAGLIPLLNLLIGLKVVAGLGTIFFHLQKDEEPVT